MCDPVSIGLGVLGGAMVNSAEQQRKAASRAASATLQAGQQADQERQRAEAEAAQRAAARLTLDQRRRREQGGLLASGAPQPTMGDTTTPRNAGSPLSPGAQPGVMPVSRQTTASAVSLIGRAAQPRRSSGLQVL